MGERPNAIVASRAAVPFQSRLERSSGWSCHALCDPLRAVPLRPLRLERSSATVVVESPATLPGQLLENMTPIAPMNAEARLFSLSRDGGYSRQRPERTVGGLLSGRWRPGGRSPRPFIQCNEPSGLCCGRASAPLCEPFLCDPPRQRLFSNPNGVRDPDSVSQTRSRSTSLDVSRPYRLAPASEHA